MAGPFSMLSKEKSAFFRRQHLTATIHAGLQIDMVWAAQFA